MPYWVLQMLSNKGTAQIPPGYFVEVFDTNHVGVQTSSNWDITEVENGIIAGCIAEINCCLSMQVQHHAVRDFSAASLSSPHV